MSDKSSIAIIGYSGHAFVVLDAANEASIKVKYYCEKNEISYNPFNLVFLGDENAPSFNWDLIDVFVLGIGHNDLRFKIAKMLEEKEKEIINIIDPRSIVSKSAILGKGNFIAANVTINALVLLRNYCILNTGCIIEHECNIEDGVHIAPGAVLAGNVNVGKHSFIGANAVVKQGVKIGENVVVGAGSVVLKDIPDGEIWMGNPAKLYK